MLPKITGWNEKLKNIFNFDHACLYFRRELTSGSGLLAIKIHTYQF